MSETKFCVQHHHAKDCIYCVRGELEDQLSAKDALIDATREGLQSIKNELGVPQPDYPAPISNAYRIADACILKIQEARRGK